MADDTTKIPKNVEIAPGVFMPMIGIGTWEIKKKEVLRDVLDAGFAA
uniref:Aldo/keto reductase n=1 Tax=Romanomermis culicivorax TaxID=13658 RepID=A0A915IPN6_ROMCU